MSKNSILNQFSFKTKYHFKQTHINVDLFSKEDIESKVREKIIPAILELETKKLIDGAYFILHAKLDLRLSCDSWDDKKSKIKRVLKKHEISDNLTNHGGPQEDEIANLDNNCLELISRLMMAYLTLKDREGSKKLSKILQDIPQHWIHYMYNQFGFININEAIDHFKYGFGWLLTALDHKQCDIPGCIDILEKLKEATDKQIGDLKKRIE